MMGETSFWTNKKCALLELIDDFARFCEM